MFDPEVIKTIINGRAPTMMFAVSDVVWQALIAAVATVVIAGMAERTKRAAVAAAKNAEDAAVNAATKAEEVKSDAVVHRAEIKTALDTHNEAQAEKMGDLSDQVAEVHKLTNSMKDELVAEVRKVSFAEGETAEKNKDRSHGNGT